MGKWIALGLNVTLLALAGYQLANNTPADASDILMVALLLLAPASAIASILAPGTLGFLAIRLERLREEERLRLIEAKRRTSDASK